VTSIASRPKLCEFYANILNTSQKYENVDTMHLFYSKTNFFSISVSINNEKNTISLLLLSLNLTFAKLLLIILYFMLILLSFIIMHIDSSIKVAKIMDPIVLV